MLTKLWLGTLAAACLVLGQDTVAVQVGEGFVAPTGMASSNDGSGRLFVVEHGGLVRVLNPGGEVTTFLDLTGHVWQRDGFCCDERGLLGIVFPPGMEAKTHFFVSYVDPQSNVLISRFEISSETGVADPGSETILQKIPHPDENHFAMDMAFHPNDGLLYWTIGDGSAGNSVRYAQDPNEVYGKVMRFDPYAGPDTKAEVYALGFRNPWRFSIDSGTGDIYVGDVGENTFEEVNYIPNGTPAKQLNFGWGVMEGYFCYEFGQCLTDGITPPSVAFDHDAGCSVTAGHVYRGAKHESWTGKFFYADFCQGNVWEAHRDEESQWVVTKVLDHSGENISTFGKGEDGEIYFANYVTGNIFVLDTAAAPIEDPPPPEEGAKARKSPGKRRPRAGVKP